MSIDLTQITHGYVVKHARGLLARCGGPLLCTHCQLEAEVLGLRQQLAEMQKDADALADEYKSLEEQVEEEITRAKEIGFKAGKHGSWL